jgi:O-antigen ligase
MSHVAPSAAGPADRPSVVVPRRRRGAREAGSPGRATYVLTLAAAAVSSWTGVRVAGLPVSDLLIATAFLTLAVAVLLRRPAVRLPLVVLVPVVAAILLLLVDVVVRGGSLTTASTQTLFSYTTGSAVTAGISGPAPLVARLVMAVAVVGFVISLFGSLHGRDRLPHVLLAWALGAAVSGAVACLETAVPLDGLPFLFRATTADRSLGLAFHPNSLAQSLVMVLPTLLYFALRWGGWRRAVLLVALAATLGGLVMSGSRAGLAAGAVALVAAWVVLLVLQKRVVAGVVSLLVAVLAALLVVVAAPGLLEGTRFGSGATGVDRSTSLRGAILRSGWQIVGENPLIGSGLGSWMGESVPIIMLTSGGLVLLLAYYAPFAEVAARVARHRHEPLAAIVLLTLGVLLAYGLLNNGFGERYLFWALFIGYELYRHREAPVDTSRPGSVVVRPQGMLRR